MPFWKKKKKDIPNTLGETTAYLPTFGPEVNANDTIISKCLLEVFGEENFNQQQLKKLYNCVETIDVSAGDMILNFGESGKGIFIILHGQVEILDKVDDELIIINEKCQGDYFGEVSTLFDIIITASVRSASRCKLIFLSKNVCGQLFQKTAKTLVDWFVQKRYLPTRIPGLEDGRVIRRHVFQVLSKLPLLWFWDEESVKKIILSKKSDLITVYPPSSIIILHGDPVNHLLVVLTGSVILKPKDTGQSFCIQSTPFVVGETDYFRRTNSSISVHAKTYCQILVINRTTLEDSLYWVLHSKVSNSTAFKSVSPIFTYRITLKSQFIVLSARQQVEISSEFGLIQVIHGEMVMIYDKRGGRKLILKEGELVWCKDIKNMKNPDHGEVLIIQYNKQCLQSAVQYCTETDSRISWIKDIIDKYSQHKLDDV
ncbi:hypothetical protein LOTGIDRAFT_229192 [Lottia gigantea]|uniref:Cyclic nucleotide-binding domain-containing protein n=1 Tax=Lottia gigantea TaxID=225164 RepID=V4A371_LOTGI|nr:hypothetical protein LOTGIDRAFT_229192 [Lottia gigantea]ESO89340.1 hypothetical protein LOTGIDRAFT_229192 [Lottia gigantea]